MSDVEPPPIKVVPMFIDEPEPEPVVEPEPVAPRFPTLRRTVGLAVLALGLATAVLVGVAVAIASGTGDAAAATTLAWVAIGTSAGAVVIGVLAAILRWGRAWAIAGAVVGVLANPLVLLWGLRAVAQASGA